MTPLLATVTSLNTPFSRRRRHLVENRIEISLRLTLRLIQERGDSSHIWRRGGGAEELLEHKLVSPTQLAPAAAKHAK